MINQSANEVQIRPAVAQDAAALAGLYDRVWSLEQECLGEKLTAERRANPEEIRRWIESDHYFILQNAANLVAVIGCELRHGTLHLVHLVVHPEHRRRGYARRLMQRVEDFAREQRAVKIWFDTAPGLTAARQLYNELGYQICGCLHRHYWGTDIVIYEKILDA